MNLRESLIIGQVDEWLALEFAPHRLTETLRAMAEAQQANAARMSEDREAIAKVAECDHKLSRYRVALEAGANPATVAARIAETEAEKASFSLLIRRPEPRPRMTVQEIRAVVDKLADIARVLSEADPNDKSEIFRQLGLRLTYQPGAD